MLYCVLKGYVFIQFFISGKNYRQTSIDSMLSNIIASPNKPKASQKKPEVVCLILTYLLPQ